MANRGTNRPLQALTSSKIPLGPDPEVLYADYPDGCTRYYSSQQVVNVVQNPSASFALQKKIRHAQVMTVDPQDISGIKSK